MSKRAQHLYQVKRMGFNMCALGAGTHGDVLNVHTETCLVDTLGFSACHTHTPRPRRHTQHNTTTRPQHHTETETETDRDRERQRETEKEERNRERSEDGRGETRQKKREDSFCSVVVHGLFFVGVVIFLLIPFAHETLAS